MWKIVELTNHFGDHLFVAVKDDQTEQIKVLRLTPKQILDLINSADRMTKLKEVKEVCTHCNSDLCPLCKRCSTLHCPGSEIGCNPCY